MFDLKMKCHVLAETLYGPGHELKSEFANLYLKLLRHERELLSDKEMDEQELKRFLAKVHKMDQYLLRQLTKKFIRKLDQEQWQKINAEEHQLLMFLFYLICEKTRKEKLNHGINIY